MTHRPSLSRTRKLLGALALGSLFFGGAALAQTTVKYGVAAVSVSYASTLIGVAAPEVFAKHGIKLEITDFRGNSNNCVAAVLSGAVDVCQVGASTVSDAVAEGGDFKILAVTTGPLSEFVMSSKAIAKMNGVTATSPVDDKLRARKGLRIVTTGPGAPHYLALDASLRRVGMTIADGLATISTPTLVISGTHDPATPAERGREIAQAIPEARYLELPTAHFGHSERPVRWLGATVDFLNARPAC